MKNMKKFFAVVLAVVMVLSTVAAASAASFSDVTETTEYKAAIDQLTALKVIEGYEDGTFKPEGEITRAEMVKMIYVLCVGTDADGKVKAPTLYVGDSVFTDVTPDHWACGYINWAASVGIVDGIGNKLFNPDASVKFSEVVKMVMLAGFVAQGNAIPTTLPSYPYGYVAAADASGLFADVDVKGASQPALRGETAQLLANLIAQANVSGNFGHITAVEGVYVGSTDEQIIKPNGWSAWTWETRTQKYIYVADDLAGTNGKWYRYDTPEDLVYGEEVTLYVDKNNMATLITYKADAAVLNTTVEGFTTSGSGNTLKYLVNGKEVKFDNAVFYAQIASGTDYGWYAVNANGLTDYSSSANVTDEPMRFIDTDGDGKYEVVLVSVKFHNGQVNNSNSSKPAISNGTVTYTASNSGNLVLNGTTAAAADTNNTYMSWTYCRMFSGTIRGICDAESVLSNVKVEKLDGLKSGVYTKVTIGGKTYTYASNAMNGNIEKLSTVTTDNKAKDTVDVRLDSNGKIVGWNYYVAPGVTVVTGADKTAYAFVKSIFAEEVVGTYTRVTQYTITVVDLDGTEVSYVLDDSVITANPSAWFAGTGNANNKISVETRNGELVPVINGKLVEYTADTFAATGTATNKVIALKAYAADVTGAAVVYNKAYTGLINVASAYKQIANIAAVIYDGKVMPVADFIALLGDSKTFTADYSEDNGKLTLQVAKFQATVAPVVTNKVYAIVTNTSVVAGSDKEHWKYQYTGTFNGVAGTYESVDCDAASDITALSGLCVATLENGKIKSFAAISDTVNYYVVSAKYGDLWMTHAVDTTNHKITATSVPEDMGAFNSITVYKITNEGGLVNSTATGMATGSLSDITNTTLTNLTSTKNVKVYGVIKTLNTANNKYDVTVFVLTTGTADADPAWTIG